MVAPNPQNRGGGHPGPPGGGGAAMRPSVPLIQPGYRVEHYEIIRPIGSGGMGEVFLARDLKLGRLVALKFLYPSSHEVVQHLLVEARATAKCTHENIVVIHDMNEHRGMPYLVLEYLEGTSLRKLHADAKLPLVRIVEVMVAVVRALAHAHAAGIIHRDLKPENIFITKAGVVKVLDFGIAKLRGTPALESINGGPAGVAPEHLDNGPTQITISGKNAPVGTWKYMSPEQWQSSEVDHRTDIWAAGVILFRLVSGVFPIDNPDAVSTMYAVLDPEQPVRSIASVVPDLHPPLIDIIDRCLRKARDERFATARELVEALESMLPRHTTGASDDRCPYPGLASFQESDAERFFGRADQIARVIDRLSKDPLMAIVGPSGVGKSSFVRAGVIPALKKDEPWDTIIMRPGRSPFMALAAAIAPAQTDANAMRDYALAVAQQMVDSPGYLGEVLRWRATTYRAKVLLYIDQFEELYTLVPDPRLRCAFVTCLRAAADDPSSPVRVVVSLRSDFLDRVAEDRDFMTVMSAGMHYLLPLGRGGLWNAIAKPAELAGHVFEFPDVIGRMVDEMESSASALPLLQFAAARMWHARDRARRMLTAASYDAMGGIAGALAVHADAVLAELPMERRHLAQLVFQRLVTPEGTRAVVDLDELMALSPIPGEVRALIDHLVAARLLVSKSDDAGSGATVELVHESLIGAWPQLRMWADASKDEAAFLVQLRQVAQQWEQRGRVQGLLWRGEAADEARRFATRLGGTVAPREQDYLSEVIALANRSGRMRRLGVIATIVALAGLAIAAIIVVIIVRDAEQKAIVKAEEAELAQKQVQSQLDTVREAEAKREAAVAEAKRATANEAAATEQIVESKEELKKKAEELKKKADDLNKALSREQEATQREHEMSLRTQKLLEEEKRRSALLAKQRKTMATELTK